MVLFVVRKKGGGLVAGGLKMKNGLFKKYIYLFFACLGPH